MKNHYASIRHAAEERACCAGRYAAVRACLTVRADLKGVLRFAYACGTDKAQDWRNLRREAAPAEAPSVGKDPFSISTTKLKSPGQTPRQLVGNRDLIFLAFSIESEKVGEHFLW